MQKMPMQRSETIYTIIGVILLILLAVTAEAQRHPQMRQWSIPASNIVSVNARLPGPGHTAEITVDAQLVTAGRLVIDAAQTGVGGYTRTELYDSGTAKTIHSVRTWNPSSYAVKNDDLTVYVSTNGGFSFTTHSFMNMAPPSNLVTGLSVTPGDCWAELSWDAYAGADGYRIYKRIGSTGRLNQVTSQLADTTSMDIASSVTFWPSSPPRLHDGSVFYDRVAGKWRWIGIYNEGNWQTGDSHSFVNFSSPDLNTWTQHERIQNTDLAGDDYKIDGYWIYHVWACYILERSGYYWMFYTGVDRQTHATDWPNNISASSLSPQRIFLNRAPVDADLDQPDVWEPVGMVLQGPAPNITDDPGWRSPTIYNPNVAWSHPCRDPHVIWSEEHQKWVMFVTANTSVSEAICAATATSLQGPWTWKGGIIATEGGAKAESAFIIKEAQNGFSLLWNSGLTSVARVDAILGNYSKQTGTIANAIWDPLHFYLAGADTMRARPYKDVARGEFCIAPEENQQLKMAVLFNHGEGQGGSTTRMQFQRFVPIGTVQDNSFTDTNLSDGVTYGYAVEPVIGGSGLSSIETITGQATVQIEALPLRVATSLSANVDVGFDMAPWSYRYRYGESVTDDCEAGVDGEVWSGWVDVSGRLTRASIAAAWTPSTSGYAHLQVQTKAQSSVALYDDQECVSVYYEPAAPKPTGASGTYKSVDDQIQLNWSAVSHPNLIRYRIQELYDPGTGYITTYYNDDDVNGWIKQSPAAGDYIYIIYSVCTVYGEESISLGSDPVIINGVLPPK